MKDAKLKFNEREFKIGEGITTIGRSTENDVAFPEDSNISRFHAEIETQGADFWLIDLNSSNGTTINSEKVTKDVLLKNGDVILLGGSSEIIFSTDSAGENKKDEDEKDAGGISVPTGGGSSADSPENKNEAEQGTEGVDAEVEPPAPAKMSWMMGCVAVTFGLAIISVVAAVLFTQCGSPPVSACEATAKIISPDSGSTINKEVKIEVEIENARCVKSVIYILDKKKVDEVSDKPYTAKLNPDKFSFFADGFPHKLQVILIDKDGKEIPQPGKVGLYFDTAQAVEETPTPESGGEEPTPTPKKQETAQVSVIKTKKMVDEFVGKLPGNTGYKPDADLLEEVQKKTSELTSKDSKLNAEGFFAKAQNYQDVINESFVKENGLPASLGFILAMSRSQFNLQSDAGEGLWRMSSSFVEENSYNAGCGEETLTDPSQKCAAKASSLYLKGLVNTVFEGDIIYSVAAFGKSTQDAINWKQKLPAERSDFWNVLKNDKNEREQVLRFIAAGIVAENPKEFGLKNDQPISQLYP